MKHCDWFLKFLSTIPNFTKQNLVKPTTVFEIQKTKKFRIDFIGGYQKLMNKKVSLLLILTLYFITQLYQ